MKIVVTFLLFVGFNVYAKPNMNLGNNQVQPNQPYSKIYLIPRLIAKPKPAPAEYGPGYNVVTTPSATGTNSFGSTGETGILVKVFCNCKSIIPGTNPTQYRYFDKTCTMAKGDNALGDCGNCCDIGPGADPFLNSAVSGSYQ